MEISQSQSLFDTSDMSDLEIDIYSDAIFSIIKSSCTDENYLESLSSVSFSNTVCGDKTPALI